MKNLAKTGAVACSLLLAGALIAYEGGYIQIPAYGQTAQPTKASAERPATDTQPVFMFSSKSGRVLPPAPTTIQSGAASPDPSLLLPSSKDEIFEPPQAASSPAMILSGSKSIIVGRPFKTPAATATASAPASPALLLGGSKSKVPAVAPPAPVLNQPARQEGGK